MVYISFYMRSANAYISSFFLFRRQEAQSRR